MERRAADATGRVTMPSTLELSVLSDRPDLPRVRAELSTWLAHQGAGPAEVDAVILACSEAVANAVEHGCGEASGGSVAVMAEMEHGHVRLTVQDPGTWDHSASAPFRGHGIELMRRLMNQVEISTGAGTVVTMKRRLGVHVRS